MPGSNHEVDPTFMDSLPLSIRDPALDLIRFASLKEMLTMRKNGPSDFYRNQYSLTEAQWNQVLSAVLLTKISYFQITPDFPGVYIDRLLEMASFAAGRRGANPAELYQAMVQEHPMFADWIKRCLIVKQQQLRAS